MDAVRRWLEACPYAGALGVALDGLDETEARLHLPYAEANTNGDQVLHGGCAASLAVIGAQALTRACLGEASGPCSTAGLQVNYLAAAKSQGVRARARLLRRGKAMCFVEVDVEGEDGRSVAHATAVARGRFGAAPADLTASRGDAGESDPGQMGPHVGGIPFMARLGISVEHMAGGTSRLLMARRGENADAGGGVHEGAALALLDTAGAMAAWGETGFGPYRGSTPALQAQFLAPPPPDDLVAYGRDAQRDGDLFWCDVEIAGVRDRRVCARGTVVYRIVT